MASIYILKTLPLLCLTWILVPVEASGRKTSLGDFAKKMKGGSAGGLVRKSSVAPNSTSPSGMMGIPKTKKNIFLESFLKNCVSKLSLKVNVNVEKVKGEPTL